MLFSLTSQSWIFSMSHSLMTNRWSYSRHKIINNGSCVADYAQTTLSCWTFPHHLAIQATVCQVCKGVKASLYIQYQTLTIIITILASTGLKNLAACQPVSRLKKRRPFFHFALKLGQSSLCQASYSLCHAFTSTGYNTAKVWPGLMIWEFFQNMTDLGLFNVQTLQ